MSRSRWAVLLGPPLIVLTAAGSGPAAATRGAPPGSPALATPRPLIACASPFDGTPQATPRSAPSANRSRPGIRAWWRSAPALDAAGTLTGWTLTVGDGGGVSFAMPMPPASSVSGPADGRVVAAIDDGARSAIRVVETGDGCVHVVALDGVVVRRAITDRASDGYLAHLLDASTRADLGVWRVTLDGRRTLVLGPIEAAALRSAGIERVWSTSLAATGDGRRLAVQSCDPDACLTRVLDRPTGHILVLAGRQGDLVGFAGDRVLTRAACTGLPCPILAWGADGVATTLADDADAAAVTVDGMVVVAGPPGSGGARLLAIDPLTGARRDLGLLAPGAKLAASGADGSDALPGGVEAGPTSIGVLAPNGSPSILEVRR
ncbi:MAG: hypothetical protein HY264_01980 [Chloroflexi bacterium]|nr:hypothetical protein [Chloroflexota bacterium]